MSRLISDSYMYRAIGAEINGACGKCKLSRSDCMCQSLSRMDLCGIIDDAPTVDAVQVVHGEWIIENTYPPSIGTHCDNCGWAWSNGIDAVKLNPVFSLIKTNYCPNCGAKMDGKEQ